MRISNKTKKIKIKERKSIENKENQNNYLRLTRQ